MFDFRLYTLQKSQQKLSQGDVGTNRWCGHLKLSCGSVCLLCSKEWEGKGWEGLERTQGWKLALENLGASIGCSQQYQVAEQTDLGLWLHGPAASFDTGVSSETLPTFSLWCAWLCQDTSAAAIQLHQGYIAISCWSFDVCVNAGWI